jgi:hypothetical protein
VRFHNATDQSLQLIAHGQISSASGERRVRVQRGDVLLWGETISTAPEELRFSLVVSPGDTEVSFTTDVPGKRIGDDERPLAFRVQNLEIVVQPAPGHR